MMMIGFGVRRGFLLLGGWIQRRVAGRVGREKENDFKGHRCTNKMLLEVVLSLIWPKVQHCIGRFARCASPRFGGDEKDGCVAVRSGGGLRRMPASTSSVRQMVRFPDAGESARITRMQLPAAVALTGFLLSSTVAVAQVVVPPALEPTMPQRNLEEAPTPRSVPQESVPLIHEQIAPEDAAEISFVFEELRIEGAIALGSDQLMSAWAFKPGDVVTVKDVFLFANAITRAYSEAGYALSFGLVPQQNIQDGIINLRVIEGFVETIEFVGHEVDVLAGAAVLSRAKAIASNILASRPLMTMDLERYTLIMNDLPGVSASIVLAPSVETIGGSVLKVEIRERKLVAVDAGYNNFMPDSLDRDVVGGSVRVNGVLTGSDQIRFGAWHSVVGDAYWSVSGDASTGLGTEGMRVGVSGSYSVSDPSDNFLSALEYLGQTTSADVHLSYPLVRSRAKNLTIGFSAALSDSESEILNSELTRDRLRSVKLTAAYDYADATRAITYMQLGLARGLDAFDASGNSRANGALDYTTVSLDVQRNQPVTDLFSGVLSARLALRGQGALGSDGLFSGAECTYGGRRFGRSYDAGVMSGEHCALASAELHWTANLQPAGFDLYGFADGGFVWQKGVLQPAERRQRSGASAGIGTRLQLTDRLSGLVEASWAVGHPTGANIDEDFRLTGALQIRF